MDKNQPALPDPKLERLAESLARNIHDLWASRGLDAALRLVPFDELPDAEQERYRDTARQTLREIAGTERPMAPVEPQRQQPTARLSLEEYRLRAARAAGEGESLAACDITGEGLQHWPDDVRLRQLRALTLARMGSHDAARQIVTQLAGEVRRDDEETLGLLARTYKDLWLESGEASDLDRAYHSYAAAYDSHSERYWTGINTATLAFARGDRLTAARLAEQVRNACLGPLATASGAERYWITGTLAEAALVRGDIEEACRLYAEASAMAGVAELGNLASTLRNARIVLRHLPPEIERRVEDAIGMPGVAVFSGHRADQPERAQPRFPNSATPRAGEAIRAWLTEAGIGVGYASAAAGGDILFLEALKSRGGRTHIVLPCSREQFIEESVAPSGADWVERFHRVMAEANEVITASEERLAIGSVGFDYANQLLHGLAVERARQFGVTLRRLAVWDGSPGLHAGTGEVVTSWRAAGHAVAVIDPLTAAIAVLPPQPSSAPAPVHEPDGFGAVTRTMLFADAHHFSKLSEAQMPDFIHRFMGEVATLVEAANPGTVFQNTWGDGLFLVFEKAPDAGRFAIRLAREVNALDRAAAGLPETLNLRIALHVGPVYRFHDRVIGRPNFIGSHVNRAARMEPITPAGQVYGTHAFAAIAALEAPGEFQCDYVGRVALAKGFGELSMYRVRGAGAVKRAG